MVMLLLAASVCHWISKSDGKSCRGVLHFVKRLLSCRCFQVTCYNMRDIACIMRRDSRGHIDSFERFGAT